MFKKEELVGINQMQGCNLLSRKFAPLLKASLTATSWNMETTSKLWDLNYEAESPEKASFLYYPDAPNTNTCKEKGEGDAENKLLERERVIHQDRSCLFLCLETALHINILQLVQLSPHNP